MECSSCGYEMGALDVSCQRCKKPMSAQVRTVQSVIASPTDARTAPSVRTTSRPHAQTYPESVSARRNLKSVYAARYGLIGFVIALVLGSLLSIALRQLRVPSAGLYSQVGTPGHQLMMNLGGFGATLVFAVPFVAIITLAGWLAAGVYEATDPALARDKVIPPASPWSEARIIGGSIGLLFAVLFVVAEMWQAKAVPPGSALQYDFALRTYVDLVPRREAVTRAFRFLTLVLTSIIGVLLGLRGGEQQYEYARRQGRLNQVGRAGLTSANSPGFTIQVDYGSWAVGVISFLMPCIGLLLWMAYGKSDDDKAGAAGIGTVLGLLAAICLGVLKTMARHSGQ